MLHAGSTHMKRSLVPAAGETWLALGARLLYMLNQERARARRAYDGKVRHASERQIGPHAATGPWANQFFLSLFLFDLLTPFKLGELPTVLQGGGPHPCVCY